MKKFLALGFMLALTTTGVTHAFTLTTQQTEIDPHRTALALEVKLEPEEHIYFNTILMSADIPEITVAPWKTDKEATQVYDKQKKENVTAFETDFTLLVDVTKKEAKEVKGTLHLTLASNKKGGSPVETLVPLTFQASPVAEVEAQEEKIAEGTEVAIDAPQQEEETKVSSFDIKQHIKAIQEYLHKTNSWFLRFLFALILGILMSLTPCIYPMIPITVGILQSQGSKSILRNFLLSLAYTLGLATTFALMGLLAASSGQAFGHMLASPVFVIFIVFVLGYFALSLFGCYNLYIPRFMQQKRSFSTGGSFFSIFLFGLASGSVASPCLSPGLALILTMVASLGSKILGFLLLFAFGIGVSTPLLIIGTFSSSINLLPRAGMWMIEIQRIFGFMLFGMCFYYLNNILPWIVMLVMLTVFLAVSGLYYLRAVSLQDTAFWRNTKNILGMGALAFSLFLAVETAQELYYPKLETDVTNSWHTENSYEAAMALAQEQNKPVLLDFWAPYCSICKIIKSTILKNPEVLNVLENHYVVITINGSGDQPELFQKLKNQYNVQGFPDLIIIDPKTGDQLHRWKSEIEDETIADVVKRFESCTHIRA